MTSCPSADQLSRLLSEELTGQERAVLETHIEACSDCQQTLETLTSEVGMYALPTPRQSEAKGLVQELRQEFVDRLLSNTPHSDQNLLAPGDSTIANQEQTRATWPSVPGYEVLNLLGQGGMAVVYKARDVRLNRLVAIKMIAAGVHGDPV